MLCRYLTVREQRLHDRRRNVEDLLKWKRRLDEEEEKIYKMEQTALKIWEGDKKDKDVKGSEKQKDNLKPPVRKDKKGWYMFLIRIELQNLVGIIYLLFFGFFLIKNQVNSLDLWST